MKRLLLGLIFFGWTAQTFAEEVRVNRIPRKKFIKIDVGEDEPFNEQKYRHDLQHSKYDYRSHNYANRKLRRRMRQLELAVRQLQDEVFILRESQHSRLVLHYSCILDAGHHGFYLGKASTRNEAKVLAYQKCSQKKGDFWCSGKPMTCEQEELTH